MAAIADHIRSLEIYAERGGARLVRESLPDGVGGRVSSDLIVLQTGLTPEQELLTLVHELTHWLAHRDAHSGFECTLFEYEAEAVEALVMARLGLSRPQLAGADPTEADDLNSASPTDGLVSASVRRVVWASGRICAALGLDPERLRSEPQAAVDL